MNLKFIFVLSFLLITCSSYSQDSSIVSLTIGNKWIYNLIRSSDQGTNYGVEVREIIGDTTLSVFICTCDSSYFANLLQLKIVKVLININNVISDETEYWYADSSVFLKDYYWLGGSFRYVYNKYQNSDSACSGFYGEDYNAQFSTTLQEDSLWGNIINTQKWRVDWHFPASPYNSDLETISTSYFRPIREKYGSHSTLFGWGERTSILKGAIIDNIIYGDTTVVFVENTIPNYLAVYLLSQNFPNPFNPITSIQYTVRSLQFVTIKVYDLLGREVTTLVNEEKPFGEYEVEFEGTGLPSGIYFYQLRIGNYTETKKMLLLK